jgi:hypothetical protein
MSEDLSSKQRDTVNNINKIYALTRQNPFWTAVITDVPKPLMNFEIQASINWNSKYVHNFDVGRSVHHHIIQIN